MEAQPLQAAVRRPITRSGLQKLAVIDTLEVGPVKLTPERLSAEYRVYQNGQLFKNTLIYRYEEGVFDPRDPADYHLASMIAAQVAVNYGLFAKKMVFHGPLDGIDQQFLRDIIENTAREIYALKLREDNPFLMPGWEIPPAYNWASYTNAMLQFSEAVPLAPQTAAPRPLDKRCGILSSGGKESLLTFSLLTEMGYEAYPLYGNESGRHWFTALNAYRHFRDNVPNTGRVWMNSDRLFSWMLQFLPFVRPDFASLRADEYPIRLWTVAVFLFGMLPLARKHRMGRILIGNEYDTTWPSVDRGIPNHSGLFDQSRHFDNLLSRYYQDRQWGFEQFSLLRQLSELMVQKILVKRYPQWQQHQVSCHATHPVEGIIRPCGKCEKCRRVISMLTAVGGDPLNCLYQPDQVAKALVAVSEKALHQEGPVYRHLLWMLSRAGHIQLQPPASFLAQKQPAVMKLRFHPDRSPLEVIPEDMRRPLFDILLNYADGAVRFNGEEWKKFDPMR
ncbi:MAG TPA: hypothetical protein PKV71_03505 [Calditrichia bacterium]|nr:hypothetical protein [Calditrichota bacterium]HQU73178.1 hypothetical protein [Calditrichia bacterium]HQV30912.1 hypothetical protein [Calditrichia bacterium]